MSAKFIRIVLVMAMLFSSIGVSAASTLCRQKQKMAAPACQKCKSESPTQKSCCKKVYAHLGVKSEYQRPAATSLDQASGLVLAVLADAPIMHSCSITTAEPTNTGPPIALSSSDRCSLISSFRI